MYVQPLIKTLSPGTREEVAFPNVQYGWLKVPGFVSLQPKLNAISNYYQIAHPKATNQILQPRSPYSNHRKRKAATRTIGWLAAFLTAIMLQIVDS
jgi:hypothetical protein